MSVTFGLALLFGLKDDWIVDFYVNNIPVKLGVPTYRAKGMDSPSSPFPLPPSSPPMILLSRET